jgi:hypothetical protein
VQRIDAGSGRLDVLVSNIWGGRAAVRVEQAGLGHDLEKGLRILRLAVDTPTHLTASHFALPLLIGRPGGLVVEIPLRLAANPEAGGAPRLTAGAMETPVSSR